MHFRLNTLLARLLIGSAIPLVLFVAVGLVAWIAIDRLLESIYWERHTREVIIKALLQREQLSEMRLALPGLTPQANSPLPERFQVQHQEFQRLGRDLLELVQDNPPQQEQVNRVLAWEEEWHRLVAGHFNLAGQGNGTKPAQKQALDFPQRSDALLAKLGERLEDVIELEESLLNAHQEKTAVVSRQSRVAIGGAGGLAILLTALVALQSARGVTRPIRQLREAASRLIAGEFRSVTPAGPTEIAQLIVHFNHMAITLTEQTRALQGREERYRTYMGAVSRILWGTNAAGEVEGDLPAWRAYTGQDEEQVRGLGWLNAVHPDDREGARQAWLDAVRETRSFERECRLRSAQGEYRHFALRGVPILNADGTVREWVGTCTDVTDCKRQDELRRDKEAAEARSRAKSEFLTRMSHELRTPLNAVIGMSKMLMTERFGRLNAKQTDYLKDITQAGEHLLALINDILDLSKVEAGKMDVHGEPFALGEAVGNLLSTLRPLAEAKGVTLRREPCPDGQLTSDPGRFRQVLYNLLSNAIKFTPAGGSVVLDCRWIARPERPELEVPEPDAEAVRVEVRDTGVGIAPQDQAGIWDEFRQLQPNAEGQQGTGLGLALTRRLVHLLGGDIWLESEPGKGSTFGFVLPRRLPPVAEAPRTEEEMDVRPVALVVEDHPPTNKLLSDWLAEAGLAPVSAFDGETGLARARELRPRLMVLDVNLPRLDGWQVLTALKSDPATAAIPVYIVSVTEDRQPSRPLAAREFFVKPVDRDNFLRRLREMQPDLFAAPGTRALVADDDPAARRLLGDMLRTAGVTVVEAANGQEAIRELDRARPDLIVLDLLMPELDGFAVAEHIRGRRDLDRVPVLVVTAKDLTEEDRRRLSGRINALLEKHRLTPERLWGHLGSLQLLPARDAAPLPS